MNERYWAAQFAEDPFQMMMNPLHAQLSGQQVANFGQFGQSLLQAMPSRILGGITPGDYRLSWQEKLQLDVNEWLKDWDG